MLKTIQLSVKVMRLLHSWEVETLLSLANKPSKPLNEKLTDEEIVSVHVNLRKNIQYYMNNFITFNPLSHPKSVYINLRLDDSDISKMLNGEKILYLLLRQQLYFVF